jgi:hypothetical protein
MSYRKGDKVSIFGIIKHRQSSEDTQVAIEVIGYYQTIWLELEHLTLVTPLFEVGDKCTWGDHGRGDILSIANDHAWIITAGGDYCTRLLTSIERVDADE